LWTKQRPALDRCVCVCVCVCVYVCTLLQVRITQVSGADLALVEEEARALCVRLGAFRADQFALDSNRRAHYLHTGPEIWTQSKGAIDAFVRAHVCVCVCVFVCAKLHHPHVRWTLWGAEEHLLGAHSTSRREEMEMFAVT
jgi:hypothetical protein